MQSYPNDIRSEPPSESVLTFGSPHKGNPCQSTKQLQTTSLCFSASAFNAITISETSKCKADSTPFVRCLFGSLQVCNKHAILANKTHKAMNNSFIPVYMILWNRCVLGLRLINSFLLNLTHL